MKLTDVIRRPLITEKTTLLREDGRTIVFEVAPDATKVDIKRAVEKLLGSKVDGVRTAIAHGKMKRQGRFVGQRSDWKKAYVKLREGEKIPSSGRGAVRISHADSQIQADVAGPAVPDRADVRRDHHDRAAQAAGRAAAASRAAATTTAS